MLIDKEQKCNFKTAQVEKNIKENKKKNNINTQTHQKIFVRLCFFQQREVTSIALII